MLKKIANESEIIFILDNLREEDKQELYVLWGNDWYNKVFESLRNKKFYILYGFDNKKSKIPIAMGGFFELFEKNSKIACVWLLSTKYISNNKKIFWSELKTQISIAESEYKILYNYIYKANNSAKNWLYKLGFCFNNPKPQGLDVPMDFEFFYKINERR